MAVSSSLPLWSEAGEKAGPCIPPLHALPSPRSCTPRRARVRPGSRSSTCSWTTQRTTSRRAPSLSRATRTRRVGGGEGRGEIHGPITFIFPAPILERPQVRDVMSLNAGFASRFPVQGWFTFADYSEVQVRQHGGGGRHWRRQAGWGGGVQVRHEPGEAVWGGRRQRWRRDGRVQGMMIMMMRRRVCRRRRRGRQAWEDKGVSRSPPLLAGAAQKRFSNACLPPLRSSARSFATRSRSAACSCRRAQRREA